MKKTTTINLSLAVFLALTLLRPAYAEVKMLSSPYNPHLYIGVGDVKQFSVAQIQNTGNETFSLEAVWMQTSSTSNLSLPVTLKNSNQTLLPGQSTEVYIIIATPSEDYIGNYSGKVEISGKVESSDGKSKVVPGTTSFVNVTAKYLRPAEWALYNLTIDNASVYINQTLTGSVTVKNVGEMTGTYTVKAKVDGQLIGTYGVTLAGDQSKQVDFLITSTVLGNHSFSVEDLSDYKIFAVLDLPTEPDTSGPRPFDRPPDEVPYGLYTLLGICTTLGISGPIIIKRKHRKKRE